MTTHTEKQRAEAGQATLLLVGALAAVLVGAFVLGAIARGVGVQGRDQRAADLGALAGGRAMRAVYYRLFEPATSGGGATRVTWERTSTCAWAGRRR
jgi:hypothetical protein